MHQGKYYSLTWHAYSDYLKSMMKEFLMNEEFSDVTLVTEDKKQIKANINILRACIPVFKDILKKEKNSSTIIYLRGIQFSEMESILQFIYLGEATFYEERMDKFLAVAKSLEIKELCNAENETKIEPESEPLSSESTENLQEEIDLSDDVEASQEKQRIVDFSSVLEIKELCNAENETKIEYEPLASDSTEKLEEETVLSDEVEAPQEKQRIVASDNFRFECHQCHKTYLDREGIRQHKRAVHERVLYPCDHCNYQATRQNHLMVHIQSIHEGVKFVCDQCDQKFSRKDNLRTHIKNKQCFSRPGGKPKQKPGATNAANESKETKEEPEHAPLPNDSVRSTKNFEEETVISDYVEVDAPQKEQGIVVGDNFRFECDQCDKTYLNRNILKQHKQVIHEGVRYPCDRCDYQAKKKCHLITHIESKHEGVKFACDQCHSMLSRNHLREHIKNKLCQKIGFTRKPNNQAQFPNSTPTI